MPQLRRENFRKTLTECPLEIAFYLLLEDIRTYRLLTIYFTRPPRPRDYFLMSVSIMDGDLQLTF